MVALNRLRPLPRFNTTFPPDIKGKTFVFLQNVPTLRKPYLLVGTGLDYKSCTWLRDFLPIFPKIAVRQTVGGRGAAEGNSKPCKPFSPTQYSGRRLQWHPRGSAKVALSPTVTLTAATKWPILKQNPSPFGWDMTQNRISPHVCVEVREQEVIIGFGSHLSKYWWILLQYGSF